MANRIRRGDRGTLAKAITVIESGSSHAPRLLKEIQGDLGNSFVIGVTGAPGTGKSTLIDRLVGHYRRAGLKVGVVAIDPSSAITGGALMGDRIRMTGHTMDKGVFIRSMASRGWSGGLSAAVSEVIQLLDAAGTDVIIVETVGTGQADVEIMRVAHAVMVVTMPGMGDMIQASKAGLMEIGDLYVVNKADLPGADRAVVDLLGAVRGSNKEAGGAVAVLKVSAARGEGIDALFSALEKMRARFMSPKGEAMRARSIRGMIVEAAKKRLLEALEERSDDDSKLAKLSERVASHEITIDEAARALLRD